MCKLLLFMSLGISVPITDDQFTCFQNFSNTGSCLTQIGQTTSVGGCCDGLGGNAYIQNSGSCMQCPQSKSYYFVKCPASVIRTAMMMSHHPGNSLAQVYMSLCVQTCSIHSTKLKVCRWHYGIGHCTLIIWYYNESQYNISHLLCIKIMYTVL